MQPDFGCDIHNLIFEQIVEESIATDIENSILDAVNTWLPYLNIDTILFDYNIISPININSYNKSNHIGMMSNHIIYKKKFYDSLISSYLTDYGTVHENPIKPGNFNCRVL